MIKSYALGLLELYPSPQNNISAANRSSWLTARSFPQFRQVNEKGHDCLNRYT